MHNAQVCTQDVDIYQILFTQKLPSITQYMDLVYGHVYIFEKSQ